MGVNVNGLRFLLYARSWGVDFAETATIGRLGLHLSLDQFCGVMKKEFGYQVDFTTLEALYRREYCDELLRYLGARTVHSFDHSDYEGATHRHDLNRPLSSEHFAR